MHIQPFINNGILRYVILIITIIQQEEIKSIFAAEASNLSNGESICYVREYETNEHHSCKLPFSIQDKLTGKIKTFHGCTTYRYET